MYKSIHDVVDKNKSANGVWFDEGALRFFNSKYYNLINGRFFVSSEKYKQEKRLFTIRMAMDSGKIETVYSFQGFNTKAQAEAYAKKLPIQLDKAFTLLEQCWQDDTPSEFSKHLIGDTSKESFCGACQWLYDNCESLDSICFTSIINKIKGNQ